MSRLVVWVHPDTGELRRDDLPGHTLCVPLLVSERSGTTVVRELVIDAVGPAEGIPERTWVAAMPAHAAAVAKRWWAEQARGGS